MWTIQLIVDGYVMPLQTAPPHNTTTTNNNNSHSFAAGKNQTTLIPPSPRNSPRSSARPAASPFSRLLSPICGRIREGRRPRWKPIRGGDRFQTNRLKKSKVYSKHQGYEVRTTNGGGGRDTLSDNGNLLMEKLCISTFKIQTCPRGHIHSSAFFFLQCPKPDI